jgi:NADH-quinone oxidoreductase subunit G
MANIEIDGKQLTVKDGSTIMQAAKAHGIYIPHFCYHKKLSIVGSCRMCLVEVDQVPKTLPSCATPVRDGMTVLTCSKKALESQKAVMEFLLINHPLDCPICDQGGECKLQETAMACAGTSPVYHEMKRTVLDKDLGPLIATNMTRCIHCTRCVRFGEQIAGFREMGVIGRGGTMEIGTYVEQMLESVLSGNIIDLCPVGALTSKPFRFKARAWELKSHPSIAAHDCVGANVMVQTVRDQVMRVIPREKESVNEVWISDRDRFSYTALNSPKRLTQPMIKRHGQWQTVDWQTALDVAIKGLKVIVDQDPSLLGALVSPNSTTEEAYLLQKMMRGLGSHNIDHRLRVMSVADQDKAPLHETLGLSLAALEQRDAVFVVGSNLRREQPLMATRIRKAMLNGAQVFALNLLDFDFDLRFNSEIITPPADFVNQLAGITKAALTLLSKDVPSALDAITVTEAAQTIANGLVSAKKSSIVIGEFATAHPFSANIRELACLLARATDSTVGQTTQGANAQGAALAGALPHRAAGGETIKSPGLDTNAMLANDLAGFLLLNVEPELECAQFHKAHNALSQAGFVVAMTPFVSERMKQYADVLLPIAPFSETAGTFVNIDGLWQSFRAANNPKGSARPAWKIISALAQLLGLAGFDAQAHVDVQGELKQIIGEKKAQPMNYAFSNALPTHKSGLQLIMETSIYCADNLVRRAKPLQAMMPKDHGLMLRINRATLEKEQLTTQKMVDVTVDGQHRKFKLRVDERVPDDTVVLSAGVKKTAGFARAFALIEVKQ